MTCFLRWLVVAFTECGLLLTGAAAPPLAEVCCGGGPILIAANQPLPKPARPNRVPALSGKVNRTVPAVALPPAALEFSAKPTAEEIFRGRLFEEPLVPVGAPPTAAENAALATALRGYAKRATPDDFSALDRFLARYPKSPWRAAVLTNLGLECYRTANYTRTINAWGEAWRLAKNASDPRGRALADRAVGELASMYARLGRMGELDALLQSVEGRIFTGPATERMVEAREGLWMMKHDPGVSFRCGPLALHRIQLAIEPERVRADLVHTSRSTTAGFALAEVAKLSEQMGLNYRAAFRAAGAPFVMPAVVHWKVGHYAAIIREENGSFLVQDPTFRNDVWITRDALETEASGYFVIPSGPLGEGWRAVGTEEGGTVWGKGNVGGPDPNGGPPGPPGPPPPCKGMAATSMDLLFISLGIYDEPVGYTPPIGPAVQFRVSYNQREAAQPANFTYSNFGAKWTFDWLAYIQDNPSNQSADVLYYQRGGSIRLFNGFNAATQSFALQPLNLTKLTRTSASSYEMHSADGSKMVFSQSDGSAGTVRKIFLKQIVDPQGNALTLTYDASLRLVAITDAIGQVSTIAYQHPTDPYKITRVTDPFGRFATFQYDASHRLEQITDVIGLTSQFVYEGASDFINALVTPYGTTSFIKAENGTTRSLDTIHPDGNRERVEFNQSVTLGTPNSDPPATVPAGMSTRNEFLWYRNTYYWSKIAYAASAGDYSKAKIYHWLHTANGVSAARILESEKEPLEGRVWYDYAGQVSGPIFVGTSNLPTHIGRVLDDGTTQLFTYEYNFFGNVTREVDPVGRTTSYHYAANGQDLIETRMTRNGASELLSRTTYNSRHLPLTVTDAAGQTTTYTYNSRGQVLTVRNAKNEVTTLHYDANGHLTSRNGPLPGLADSTTWTYDVAGRVRTVTDPGGYSLTFDYDALDRLTRITFPDGTYEEHVFTRLDRTLIRDRAGRETVFEHNSVREMTKRTDPLNRVTRYQWCKCGDLKSLTDPMGRTTTWRHDLQGRVTAKEYADGSRVTYQYENTTSRQRQRIDEQLQVTQYTYALDDNVTAVSYANAAIPTPSVVFTYDPDYDRARSMTDGSGTTLFSYYPMANGPSPGAGQLASVDGPLPNDTVTYAYDELGRQTATAINGAAASMTYDATGRVTNVSNPLGAFTYTYDGSSGRLTAKAYPNGQTTEYAYGNAAQDQRLQRITHKLGGSAISEFLYSRNAPRSLVTSWSQQAATQTPAIHSFTHDAVGQLTAAAVTVSAVLTNVFGYSYDLAGNRLTETIDATTRQAAYNALNELTTTQLGSGSAAAYEWDAEHRLIAVNAGNQRTEFTYDGLSRRVGIRHLVDNAEVSNRRFVWCGAEICEERTAAGVVTKRFFEQGMKVEVGPAAGVYFYTFDHLGSIRELTDSGGNVRARYTYDPFGRQTRVVGDLEADFGFAGMLWSPEAGLNLTLFRAYDPSIGRWLSRDPLLDAESEEGPNLYAYVRNDPIGARDRLGLCCEEEAKELSTAIVNFFKCDTYFRKLYPGMSSKGLVKACDTNYRDLVDKQQALHACLSKPCKPPKCEKK